ncbi:MAG: hypothetical protein AAFR23_04735 [Pseudomonadota bacterium]
MSQLSIGNTGPVPVALRREGSPGVGLTPPASTGPEAIHAWARDHTVQLKRILENLKGDLDQTAEIVGQPRPPVALADIEGIDDAIDERTQQTRSALQSAIDALGVEIENIDSLTPQQIFEISLATRTEELVGGAGEEIAEALEWSQRAAEEALAARIRGYETGASIRVLQTTQSSNTAALAQQIETVTAALDVSASESAQRSAVLQAELDAAQADLATVQSDADATQADLDAAEARVADAEAAIAALQAGQAQIAAQVQNEITARVNGDNALAQQVQTVSTTVAGNTSSVTQLQQSVDGLESRWGIAVNANGQVLGTIQLSGDASGSVFAVIVDRFVVARPDGTDATPVFAVGQVNGESGVGIQGSLLIDGSILARHIAAGQIDAAKLNVDALSAISANIGDAVFTGKARGANDLMVIDFDAPRIRMVSAGQA